MSTELEKTAVADKKESKPKFSLPKKTIIVRHVPREYGLAKGKDHVNYGGMSPRATREFVIPYQRNGTLKNVLTDEEMVYFADLLGKEVRELSVYYDDGKFWKEKSVVLTKADLPMDLSNADIYLQYKLLLANENHIAASPAILNSRKKATYQFVLVDESLDGMEEVEGMDISIEATQLFAKHKDNSAVMKYAVEKITKKTLSPSIKESALQGQLFKILQKTPGKIVTIFTDPLLDCKVTITKCIDKGIIVDRSTHLYNALDGKPLCDSGSHPTLEAAAEYLSSPKNHDLFATLKARLNS